MDVGNLNIAHVREQLRTLGANLQWTIVEDSFPASRRKPAIEPTRESWCYPNFRYEFIHPVGRPDDPPGPEFQLFLEAAREAAQIALFATSRDTCNGLELEPFRNWDQPDAVLADAWIWLVHQMCWDGVIPTSASVTWGAYEEVDRAVRGRSEITCAISIPCVEALDVLEACLQGKPAPSPGRFREVHLFPLGSWPSRIGRGKRHNVIEVETLTQPGRCEEIEKRREDRHVSVPYDWLSQTFRLLPLRDKLGGEDLDERVNEERKPWVNYHITGRSLVHASDPDCSVELTPQTAEWASELLKCDGEIGPDNPFLVRKISTDGKRIVDSQISRANQQLAALTDNKLRIEQSKGRVRFVRDEGKSSETESA